MKLVSLLPFSSHLLIGINLFFILCAKAQVSPLTSCSASECRFNQSNGVTSSVGVGVNSSFGVSSSAQSTPNFTASASSSLILDADSAILNPSGINVYPFRNSSIQTIGSQNSTDPISIVISSDTIQAKSKDGSSSQTFSQESQATSSSDFSDNSSTNSDATFTAEGFSAVQDLRFLGSTPQSSGSEYKSSVTPIAIKDSNGNPVIGKEYGTGNSSASAETRSRFQADITTSTFVNAFMSSF